MNEIEPKTRSFVDLIETANQKLVFLCSILLLVLLPFLIARFILQWSLFSFPFVLHLFLLLVFFAILSAWAWMISGDRGGRLFSGLYSKGIRWPFLFSVALAAFSIPCFACLTTTLATRGYVHFTPAIPSDSASLAVVQDFYLWHLLKAVPSLEITKTIRWDAPFEYQDKLSGWILLVFKLVVIVPVIGSFAAWNKVRKEPRRENEGHST